MSKVLGGQLTYQDRIRKIERCVNYCVSTMQKKYDKNIHVNIDRTNTGSLIGKVYTDKSMRYLLETIDDVVGRYDSFLIRSERENKLNTLLNDK